jgi:hypothetical protein
VTGVIALLLAAAATAAESDGAAAVVTITTAPVICGRGDMPQRRKCRRHSDLRRFCGFAQKNRIASQRVAPQHVATRPRAAARARARAVLSAGRQDHPTTHAAACARRRSAADGVVGAAGAAARARCGEIHATFRWFGTPIAFRDVPHRHKSLGGQDLRSDGPRGVGPPRTQVLLLRSSSRLSS